MQKESAVSLTPWSQAPGCEESSSAVSVPLESQAPGVIDTAESGKLYIIFKDFLLQFKEMV